MGLDNAGKSSILCSVPQVKQRLAKYLEKNSRDDGQQLRVEPTSALQLVKFSMTRSSQHRCHRRATIQWHVWDVSGQGMYRPLWSYFCSLAQAVIFVVDVTDVERVAVARNELSSLFASPAMSGLPLLILANKIDARHDGGEENTTKRDQDDNSHLAISRDMLKGMLDLDSLQTRHRLDLKIVECSALTGAGIEAAFQWLTDHVVW